jgi:hypothetical protein
MGTNITHEPSIIISNYEQVTANTVVTISFANTNNLPADLRNTLSVEVKYYRVGDTTEDQMYSFNMYEPTEAITDATTAPITPVLPTSLVITYPGQNVVNEPTTFQIDLTPTVPIALSDYIVVQFPKNGVRDEYSRFNVSCIECSKV